ncbi:PEP-CTERM sorting domain-containing protein [uncultured Nostoc sp.]|uniref:PEP-CTERM sorting domain-containing protein n=1 Tax=uncultured Nostoc sp. TaxID=340711 RepID=UPI0035CB8AF6
MTKNNRKKAVAQAISTAVALGWVIMQVESAQAATLTVNNLDDSGFGSLRDVINTATSNDVVEFLLGSNPSTINLTSGALAIAKNLTINGLGANLLTISSNNQFPVFDISAANVTLSGLAIAGNFNAYNSSNLTFTNSTVSGDNFKIDSNLRLINSTISSNNIEINASDVVTLTENSHLVSSNNIEINSSQLIVQDDSSIGTPNGIINSGTLNISTANPGLNNNVEINAGSNNSGLGGNITITTPNLILTRVPEPSAIAAGNINSGAAGNITISSGTLILKPGAIISKPVPEPSAIAGTILAGSLAWLAKRKQAAFRKAKV